MAKPLVIVESPAKAKTISKYLGGKYQVRASMGHVRDLPQKKLGVDVENNFEPTYQPLPDRVKVVEELKKAAGPVEAVYLATDPDREGEAISWHIMELLSGNGAAAKGGAKGNGKAAKASKKEAKNFYRVTFQEITKKAIEQAFKNAGAINMDMVNAQQARRILDRLVGYKISPLLWKNIRRGLSAGRVQSVTLRMIVDREREIQAFKSEEFWTVHAKVKGGAGAEFEALALKFLGKKLKLANKNEADAAIAAMKKAAWSVESVDSRPRQTAPNPPFITSTLQQEAARRFGFTVQRTMREAQRLYEGVEIGGEGSVGLITYMRTDSPRMSEDVIAQAREFIARKYGKDYVPEEPRRYRGKTEAQDAHECVRPTSVERTPDAVKDHLTADALKLYRLIWERAVASQMASARFDSTKADIRAGDYLLRAEGSVLRFDGFMRAHPPMKKSDDVILPPLKQGQALTLLGLEGKQHFTQPPPRYTEATLVKELERNGIGRPSTYASIIQVIQNRAYVSKQDGKFVPGELGCLVADMLVKHFADIMDTAYTARLEEELDKIEEGKLDWVKSMEDFYKRFAADLKKADKQMEKHVETSDEKCEKCGSPMLIRWGKFGKFLACSKYPECKNTREIAPEGQEAAAEGEPPAKCHNCGKDMKLRSGRFGQFYACTGYPECKTTVPVKKSGGAAAPAVTLDEKCPECKKNLVRRTGRYGEFVSCSGYPKCRYIKAKTVGVKCPDCGGDIAERVSKRGVFYGCVNYPKCKFVLRHLPIAKKCPKCKAPFLLLKETKKEGRQYVCAKEECGYKAPAPEDEAKAAAS